MPSMFTADTSVHWMFKASYAAFTPASAFPEKPGESTNTASVPENAFAKSSPVSAGMQVLTTATGFPSASSEETTSCRRSTVPKTISDSRR